MFSSRELSNYIIRKQFRSRIHSSIAMVCVPCFIVPVLLFIWRLVILPLYRRIWGGGKAGENKKEPEFPFECKGGVCPIKPKDRPASGEGEGDPITATTPKRREGELVEDKKAI